MPSDRTRVRRLPDRGHYDRETIDPIIDDAMVAHVGFVAEGHPYVIPMAVARHGDELFLHGSTASRLMKTLSGSTDVCVTVTHLDGLIVSRTLFDSSMNYRSVVVLGHARVITEPAEKLAALRVIVEHLLPGRWDEARTPSNRELKATTLLAVPLDEASAKIRSGPPQDDDANLGLPSWAGEIPLTTIALEPVADPHLASGTEVPASVRSFVAQRRRGSDQ
jgi:nitroimidazol reductase NimA-like FMN-containing flavoprotein (pyridoxamine 5'-phosphate oxidase superfamily)